jgi:uncharacterized protein (DUF433 family)
MKRTTAAPDLGKSHKPKFMGHYIVTDPAICHGQPTFRGTRIMVRQVLEMVASGLAWETIIEQCHHSVPEEALAEAVSLASKAFLDHAQEYTLEPMAA